MLGLKADPERSKVRLRLHHHSPWQGCRSLHTDMHLRLRQRNGEVGQLLSLSSTACPHVEPEPEKTRTNRKPCSYASSHSSSRRESYTCQCTFYRFNPRPVLCHLITLARFLKEESSPKALKCRFSTQRTWSLATQSAIRICLRTHRELGGICMGVCCCKVLDFALFGVLRSGVLLQC